MPQQQPTYLDDSGNPKVTYLDDNGEPAKSQIPKEEINKAIGFTPFEITDKPKGFLQSMGESMFSSMANPQSVGDMLGLALPALPEGLLSIGKLFGKGLQPTNKLGGRLEQIGQQVIDESIPVTRVTRPGDPLRSLGNETWFIKEHLDNLNSAKINDMYAGGKGNINRTYINKSDIINPVNEMFDEFGNQIFTIPSNKVPNISKPKIIAGPEPLTPQSIVELRRKLQTPKINQIPENAEMFSAQFPKLDTSLMNEATNFTKSMMASMDVSAPLRQGLPLIHKKEWWSSLDDMFKSLVSEKQYQGLMQSIESKPTYALQKKSGLSFTNLKDLSMREEAYMSKWVEKIPGVRASERAYVGFLNKLRSDTFDSLITQAEKAGRDLTPELTRGIAKFVNTATGRGSLGSLEKAAVELNYALFSPRLISSRLTMLNPMYYVKADPFVRKEALKSLLAIATAGETVTQLGKMAGGTIVNDPNSPDFQKVKIGNVRLDPFGGFQQYIVAASKLITGKATSSTTGKSWNMGESFVAPTRLSTVANFGRNKLSPVMSFVADFLAGKDATGKPFNTQKALVDRITPMLMMDLYKLYQEDPSLLPLGLGAASGMGVQVYDR